MSFKRTFQITLIYHIIVVVFGSYCVNIGGDWTTFTNKVSISNCFELGNEYELISCGIQSSSLIELPSFNGAYINNSQCIGISKTSTIKSIARCCNIKLLGIKPINNCIHNTYTYNPNIIESNTNNIISLSCPNNYNLLSCGINNYNIHNLKGLCLNNNGNCNPNTNNNKQTKYCSILTDKKQTKNIQLTSKCCPVQYNNEFKSTCISVWSQNMEINSKVVCPNNYIMTDCHAFSNQHNSVYGWGNIITNSNGLDECQPQSKGNIYSMAICCLIDNNQLSIPNNNNNNNNINNKNNNINNDPNNNISITPKDKISVMFSKNIIFISIIIIVFCLCTVFFLLVSIIMCVKTKNLTDDEPGINNTSEISIKYDIKDDITEFNSINRNREITPMSDISRKQESKDFSYAVNLAVLETIKENIPNQTAN